MNCAWSATKNKGRRLIAAALLVLGWGCASAAKPEPPKPDAPVIVWPLPPDPPRVKFVDAMNSSRDVQGKSKRNLKEVLLGIEPDRLAVTLKRPAGITTDSKGRVLVTDPGNPGIHVYDIPNHKFALYGGEGEGALAWPMGIAVDAQDNIYVSDHKRQRVAKYAPDGAFLLAIGDFGNPVGVAVDKARGLLFVVDSQRHQVKQFSLDGTLKETIGERGSEEGQFNYPTFCAVDQAGSLYVVDSANFRIQVLDKNLEVVGSFGEMGNAPGQFTRPKGIAVDRRGIIYVSDSAFGNIQMFDPEFRLLLVVGGPGTERGQFQLPTSLWVDDQDRIYVADYGNSRFQILQFLSESLGEGDLVTKKP